MQLPFSIGEENVKTGLACWLKEEKAEAESKYILISSVDLAVFKSVP